MGHSQETRTVFVPIAQKKAAGKRKRDPNAPKRGATAYIRFANKRRPIVKGENPGLAFGEINKKLGEEWKALSEDAKKPFNDETEADKARYNQEMAAYKRAHPTPVEPQQKKRKDMSEAELARIAAEKAISAFIQDEEDNMAEDAYKYADSDEDEEPDVYDRVQPPGPGSLTCVGPLPPRVTAEKTLEMLQGVAWNRDDTQQHKDAKAWLQKVFQHQAEGYIRAYREGYSGVVIPFSKSEEKKRRESQGIKGIRGQHFLVSFDYHH
jgi:hypothetical protein